MTGTSTPAPFRRLFIVIEGPNGTGKTSVAASLAARLRAGRRSIVEVTREPSDTSLGRAIRELEASMPAKALALACAADRFDHVTRTIEPSLARGSVVVSDRFLPSSLVLQRLDGFTLEEIWQLNAGLRSPDATVYLEATPTTLRGRLAQRTHRTRFEEATSTETELDLYRDARTFLSHQGWRQIVVSTEAREVDDVAAEIEQRLRR